MAVRNLQTCLGVGANLEILVFGIGGIVTKAVDLGEFAILCSDEVANLQLVHACSPFTSDINRSGPRKANRWIGDFAKALFCPNGRFTEIFFAATDPAITLAVNNAFASSFLTTVAKTFALDLYRTRSWSRCFLEDLARAIDIGRNPAVGIRTAKVFNAKTLSRVTLAVLNTGSTLILTPQFDIDAATYFAGTLIVINGRFDGRIAFAQPRNTFGASLVTFIDTPAAPFLAFRLSSQIHFFKALEHIV